MITSPCLDRKRMRLLNAIQDANQQLENLPDGKIYFIRNGKNWKWKLRLITPEGKRKSIILKKSELDRAQKLAARRYLEERCSVAQKLIQLIDQVITTESELVSFPYYLHEKSEDYQRLLSHYFSGIQEQIAAWNSVSYKTRTDRPEQHIYPTKCDVWVCSKSEALIADLLHDMNIPFRYEPEIVIGKSILHPDFVILNPITLEEVIWEHCGLMDDPKYAKTVFSRLELLYAAGFSFEKNNLICTYESKEHPLDVRRVQMLIEEYFLGI